MQLPGPVRAVVGLLATAADEAKHLPDRAIELPMLAVSSALQMSLRAQQRYARLAARGDDVINRRPPGAEPPAWATFDDPVSADEVRAATLGDPDPALRASAATQLLDELLGTTTPDGDVGIADAVPDADAATVTPIAKKAAAKKAAAAAAKAPAKKPGATKVSAKAAAKKTVTKKTGPAKGKTINPPRHGNPSRFDTVGDD